MIVGLGQKSYDMVLYCWTVTVALSSGVGLLSPHLSDRQLKTGNIWAKLTQPRIIDRGTDMVLLPTQDTASSFVPFPTVWERYIGWAR
jgi:hypothetical protein